MIREGGGGGEQSTAGEGRTGNYELNLVPRVGGGVGWLC